MALTLGAKKEIRQLTQLTGGLECDTYAFELDGRSLVMKLFPSASSRSVALLEFENLLAVAEANLLTPSPVFLDEAGVCFGTPALVMSALSGRPDLHPSDVGMWIRGAATVLAAIHDVDPAYAHSPLNPRWRRWQPDTKCLERHVKESDEALQELYRRATNCPVVFSHDDFNPGNVLFDDGRLSGVVDWADVTIEPRQAAIALYRHQLAVHPGGSTPDLFLAEYEAATDMRVDDIPFWDVLYGFRGIRPVPHWVRAYQGLGVKITQDEINARSSEWVERALIACRG